MWWYLIIKPDNLLQGTHPAYMPTSILIWLQHSPVLCQQFGIKIERSHLSFSLFNFLPTQHWIHNSRQHLRSKRLPCPGTERDWRCPWWSTQSFLRSTIDHINFCKSNTLQFHIRAQELARLAVTYPKHLWTTEQRQDWQQHLQLVGSCTWQYRVKNLRMQVSDINSDTSLTYDREFQCLLKAARCRHLTLRAL